MANKMKLDNAATALVLTVIGCVLFIMPGIALKTLIRLIGILLVLVGGLRLAGLYKEGELAAADKKQTFFAVSSTVAGAVIMLFPKLLVTLFPIIAGVFILLHGIANLKNALDAKKRGASSWQSALIIAVITTASGVLILINPVSTTKALVRIIGAILIWCGLTGLWTKSKNDSVF